jgi:hypothetical protein
VDVGEFSTRKPLLGRVWHRVAASFDAATGEVRMSQTPVVTITNGGHAMALLNPSEDTTGSARYRSTCRGPRATDCPLLLAASTQSPPAARLLIGAHCAQLAARWEFPVPTQKYDGRIERPRLVSRALSDVEIETLPGMASVAQRPGDLREALVAAWDFNANIAAHAACTHIVDTGPHSVHGVGVNLPVRGVTGFNWSSDCVSFRHAPREYGAIHFHDESATMRAGSPLSRARCRPQEERRLRRAPARDRFGQRGVRGLGAVLRASVGVRADGRGCAGHRDAQLSSLCQRFPLGQLRDCPAASRAGAAAAARRSAAQQGM